jgi:hypothetical protein
MADSEKGGVNEYEVNGTKFTDKEGAKLDSLSNRLRDLQHIQTMDFKKNHPDVPVEDILKNEESDPKFKNQHLDHKADSLRSVYGDRKIPVNDDYKKTYREYNKLTNAAGVPISNKGEKEAGFENFGYRAMLQKYPHKKGTPAYKSIEGKDNKPKPTLEEKVKNPDNKWQDDFSNALASTNTKK